MTGSSTPSNISLSHAEQPDQGTGVGVPLAERAAATLVAVQEATEVLLRVVASLSTTDYAAPSLLPGWTRGHVVTHLARNADALVNLLTWARTGIEHPAYLSRADRDADIADGARRVAQVQREDLIAACERWHSEAARLSDTDWSSLITHPSGRPLAAAEIPEVRLFEVWTHLMDLDAGQDFTAVAPAHLDLMLDTALRKHSGEGGAVRLLVDLPDGRQRTWELAIATQPKSREVRGSAADVLAWITERGDGSALIGTPPKLGPWG